ncbi:MAG: biotin-dependent carboxylase-like uncharacterized protein [Saprospiraceae bacterium]|jgi:biotin-dependent carboxylase-like uncharacterized protein
MIKVLRAGTYITLVDRGRYGYRRYGVPTSGPMDMQSATVANTLLSNSPEDALLELYMPGHRLQFSSSATIALAGAEASIELDNILIETNQVYKVKSGSILSIGKFRKGSYLYLAIKGGIESQIVLNSRSPLSTIFPRQIRTGDTLSINELKNPISTNVHIAPLRIDYNGAIQVRPGPEWHLLSDKDKDIITSTQYVISNQSNRMGFRMEGLKTRDTYSGILSSGVMPGTVQLLPSGLPLILMRECQTTGGYMRILQIASDSINQLAQRSPDLKVIFNV